MPQLDECCGATRTTTAITIRAAATEASSVIRLAVELMVSSIVSAGIPTGRCFATVDRSTHRVKGTTRRWRHRDTTNRGVQGAGSICHYSPHGLREESGPPGPCRGRRRGLATGEGLRPLLRAGETGLRTFVHRPALTPGHTGGRNGSIIGYLLASWHGTFFANGPVAWVEELMVAQPARGSGVGRALVAEAKRWARSVPCAYIAIASAYAASMADQESEFPKGIGAPPRGPSSEPATAG